MAKANDRGTQEAIGRFLRQQREAAGISLSALALGARISRTTLRRLEQDVDIRTTPARVANVVRSLGLDLDDVSRYLPNDQWGAEVRRWLTSGDALDAVSNLAPQVPVAPDPPDLLALHDDGTTLMVTVKHAPQDDDEQHLADLQRALKRLGYIVTRPM